MNRITLSVVFLFFAFAACKKGDTGPAGADGADGMDGNANVTQYNFGAANFPQIGFLTLQISTTRDTMDKSTWLVYLYYQPIDRWYFVPGLGPGGANSYRVSMGYSGNKVNIYVDKTGTGDNFSQSKVIRIYNNNILPGGRMADPKRLPVDVTDYEAVKKYYNL